MNAELDSAKERLRYAASRERSADRKPGVDEAKARLRVAAARFDQVGDEIVRHLGVTELAGWVKEDPWRAVVAAALSGFFAGSLKESEVVLLSLMLRLLDLSSAEIRKSPGSG